MHDAWKERLSFVSGNILGWALVLSGLWPWVARAPIGANIHFWTTNLPYEGVRSELWAFWILTAVLSMGITATVLSVFYILLRGCWLGLSAQDDALLEGWQEGFDRACKYLYGLLLSTLGVVLFFAPLFGLIFVKAGVETFLIGVLSFSRGPAGWIGYAVIMVLFVALFVVTLRRFGKRIGKAKQATRTKLTVVLFAWMAVWMITLECCYTVSLKASANLVSKEAEETVEVEVMLGGAASDPSEAKLTLRGPDARESTLELHPLSEGRHLAYVHARDLKRGSYELRLRYPRIALSRQFPFLQLPLVRAAGFLVIP